MKAVKASHVEERKADRDAAKELGKERREEIQETWDGFHDDWGKLADYLRTDLSGEDKQALRTLLKDTEAEATDIQKEFVKNFTNSDNAEAEVAAVVEELSDLRYDIHDDIAAYVADDKEDAYYDFVEAWVVAYIEAKSNRLLNFVDKKEFKQTAKAARKHHLPDGFTTKLDKILTKIDDDKKDDVLTRFLEVLEMKMDQIEENDKLTDDTKERVLDLL